jgi:pimeloyl-ACP methyl ester carboxylesterase
MPERRSYFSAQDGLRLFYRDYGDPRSPATPVLCLPGLNRNSLDFADLAQWLCEDRRVICPDLRGRGLSAYDPDPVNYAPMIYLNDLRHLLTVTGCHRVIVIGTSLGGILGAAMGVMMATSLAGLVLNDIGPDIDPRGLARIGGYTGIEPGEMTEAEAVALLKERFAAVLPDFNDKDWKAEAARTFRLGDDGLYRGSHDPAIARSIAPPMDLWPVFRSLRQVPTLAFRGALSDILAAETLQQMTSQLPELTAITVPNRGHTPLLSEPECLAAITRFLETFGREH